MVVVRFIEHGAQEKSNKADQPQQRDHVFGLDSVCDDIEAVMRVITSTMVIAPSGRKQSCA